MVGSENRRTFASSKRNTEVLVKEKIEFRF